jgi:hypothetical protein
VETPVTEPSSHPSAAAATEAEDGMYVYSIIECTAPCTFGRLGIGGRFDDVYTVHYKDLAAAVSRSPLVVYDPTRENVLAHEHVNEVIIEDGFTPVPMSFGTLFKTEKDIVEFLEDTYYELRDVLVKMKDKLEFGLRVNWAREEVLADIERDDEGIRRLKEEIAKSQQSTYFARMQLGRMVEQALADRSDAYVRDIYEYLRDGAIASRSNKPIGDRMIMNAAFLVERERAEHFDRRVQEIAQRFEGKLSFRYTGPWPPYNFVTIRLQLERSVVV